MNSPGRRSIKYYVHIEGRVFRVRSKDQLSLVSGELRLPQFANREIRIIEVVTSNDLNVVTRSLRGLIQHFDADGALNVSEAVDAVDLTLRSNRFPDSARNVVNLMPELERRAWDKRHMWAVDQNSIDLIDNDLLKKAKLPTFQI